jgi:hypothetical protein
MPTWATVLLSTFGPLIGVALGWFLKTRSDTSQWYRAEVRTAFADLLVKLDSIQHATRKLGMAVAIVDREQMRAGFDTTTVLIEELDRALSAATLLVAEDDASELRRTMDAALFAVNQTIPGWQEVDAKLPSVGDEGRPHLTLYEAHQLAVRVGRRAIKAGRLAKVI